MQDYRVRCAHKGRRYLYVINAHYLASMLFEEYLDYIGGQSMPRFEPLFAAITAALDRGRGDLHVFTRFSIAVDKMLL